MKEDLTIKQARHGGYLVVSGGRGGYEYNLMFAGSLSACLMFINGFYSKDEKSEG